MAVESRRESRRLKGSPLKIARDILVDTVTTLHTETPPAQQQAMGFFTDTSVCIGCKACEVACKQWNQLPGAEPSWSGNSYDNTGALTATTWRHVQFIEQIGRRKPKQAEEAAPVSQMPEQPGLSFFTALGDMRTLTVPDRASSPGMPDLPLFDNRIEEAKENGAIPETPPGTALPFFNTDRWLLHSDVCKHCKNAPCHEACPTGAIIRTEFDTVYVQQDICNGCAYCTVACPFGVIARDSEGDGRAHKCTLCYDRLKDGFEPACAKACPTDSIQFGPVEELKAMARERVGILHKKGATEARLYGVDDNILEDGLNSFFLLLDEPEVYNLPSNPQRPSNNIIPTSLRSVFAVLFLSLMGMLFFKSKE